MHHSSLSILLDMLKTFCKKILLLHSDQLKLPLLAKNTFLFQALNENPRSYVTSHYNLLQKYKFLKIKMEV